MIEIIQQYDNIFNILHLMKKSVAEQNAIIAPYIKNTGNPLIVKLFLTTFSHRNHQHSNSHNYLKTMHGFYACKGIIKKELEKYTNQVRKLSLELLDQIINYHLYSVSDK